MGDPAKTETYRRILDILDSKDKIAHISRIGGYHYNLWQDADHVAGIWRKTTLASYKTSAPVWQTVLDIDALDPPQFGTAKTWVWHGSTLLDEGHNGGAWTTDRALIQLSPGGSDADTTREFDLITEQFIDVADGGYALPTAAKTRISYRSRNELLIGTDFGGDGTALTESGYPRVVKSWKRGTPIEAAVTVFEAEKSDIVGVQYAYHDRGHVHEFQTRSVTFFTSKRWYRRLTAAQLASASAADEVTPFVEVPIPDDAKLSTFGACALITLRSAWTPHGCAADCTYTAGALLSVPIDDAVRNVWTAVTVLFEPTADKSLRSTTATRDYLVLKVLEHVRTKLVLPVPIGSLSMPLWPSE